MTPRPPDAPPRVRFFASCVADRFFADAARDAVRLLRSLGVEVDVPAGVACCGQPAWNAGHAGEARRVAKHALDALPGDVPVVVASGSCAAMMRRAYPELAPGVPVPPVYELAEYVVDVLGVTALGRGLDGLRVAYHHGCHALRELGVRTQPLVLLASAGAEIVEWEAAEECCGFGGLFAVKLPWVSAGMADRKLDTLPGADVLASADGGCLLQLRGRWGMRRGPTGSSVPGAIGGSGSTVVTPRFAHLASLLLEARS